MAVDVAASSEEEHLHELAERELEVSAQLMADLRDWNAGDVEPPLGGVVLSSENSESGNEQGSNLEGLITEGREDHQVEAGDADSENDKDCNLGTDEIQDSAVVEAEHGQQLDLK